MGAEILTTTQETKKRVKTKEKTINAEIGGGCANCEVSQLTIKFLEYLFGACI